MQPCILEQKLRRVKLVIGLKARACARADSRVANGDLLPWCIFIPVRTYVVAGDAREVYRFLEVCDLVARGTGFRPIEWGIPPFGVRGYAPA